MLQVNKFTNAETDLWLLPKSSDYEKYFAPLNSKNNDIDIYI